MGLFFILIISFFLTGCYTQLSRPRVATEDEYYQQSEDVEEYYQDEGTINPEDSRDVNIYNYYPYYGPDYFDYWYWNPYGYRWGYIGPYPNYWWDPYGHWWMPGWYVGIYYHDYWWGGYPRYYDSYHRYGRYTDYQTKTYGKRPFSRRSVRVVERDQKPADPPASLAQPQKTNPAQRPGSTISKPVARDEAISSVQKKRIGNNRTDQVIKNKGRVPSTSDEVRPKTPARRPTTVKKPEGTPRTSKNLTKPKIIEQAPARDVPRRGTPTKNYSPPKRSEKSSNSAIRSNNPRVSSPPKVSSPPRSSSNTKSTPPPRSSSSSSSSSKSSGSSKTKK